MKFHHLGIIVKKINPTLPSLKKNFNIKKTSKIFIDKKWNVKIIFLHLSKNVIFEIIEPLNKRSPISKALKKNINVLNHVAFTCNNFDRDKKNIIKNGAIAVTDAIEAIAFKKKKIQFFLTKENFLVELIKEK